jgi:hypothetical protein
LVEDCRTPQPHAVLVSSVLGPLRDPLKLPGRNDFLAISFLIVFYAAVFASLNAFRNELDAHFNVMDPIGLDLRGWKRLPWMFAFNAFYFQFHFHKLYKKQRKVYRSLVAG